MFPKMIPNKYTKKNYYKMSGKREKVCETKEFKLKIKESEYTRCYKQYMQK